MHETKGIAELHGFEVAEGDPDVRGWEVVTRDGRVGEVAELLADSEDPSVRYLEVRLDVLPDEEEVLNQAAVPGDGPPPEMPARRIGEALVRDSLLDIENQMTSGGSPGFDRGQNRVLIPAGQARLEAARRQVRIESLPARVG